MACTTYTQEEQRENRRKWTAALRSGKYEQGRRVLQSEEGYCCLGVACDVYEKETENKLPRDHFGAFDGYDLSGDFRTVKDWLGLRDYEGEYNHDSVFKRNILTLHNDSKCPSTHLDFNGIADLIEKEPAGLIQE